MLSWWFPGCNGLSYEVDQDTDEKVTKSRETCIRFSVCLTWIVDSKVIFAILYIRNNQSNQSAVPGRVAQSVTCLATDATLTADPGGPSLIPAQSHTFMVIDHEIISTVLLLPSADSFKKGCCQLQTKVCARSTR